MINSASSHVQHVYRIRLDQAGISSRQTNIQTNKYAKKKQQTNKQTYKQTYKQTNKHPYSINIERLGKNLSIEPQRGSDP